MIPCDRNFTKSLWKNTSSSTVLCALLLKDSKGHHGWVFFVFFPPPFPPTSWLKTVSCQNAFSRVTDRFLIGCHPVTGMLSLSIFFLLLTKPYCGSWFSPHPAIDMCFNGLLTNVRRGNLVCNKYFNCLNTVSWGNNLCVMLWFAVCAYYVHFQFLPDWHFCTVGGVYVCNWVLVYSPNCTSFLLLADLKAILDGNLPLFVLNVVSFCCLATKDVFDGSSPGCWQTCLLKSWARRPILLPCHKNHSDGV